MGKHGITCCCVCVVTVVAIMLAVYLWLAHTLERTQAAFTLRIARETAPPWTPSNANLVFSVAFSADGKYLLVGSMSGMTLWDVDRQQCVRSLIGHESFVNDVAISQDGRRALSGSGSILLDGDEVSASTDDVMRLWDLPSGREIGRFGGHDGPVTCVAFARDDKWGVSGSEDGLIRIWDLENGNVLRRLDGHKGPIEDIAISSDGNYLVSSGGPGDCRLVRWDLLEGAALAMPSHYPGFARSIAYSRDGNLFVSAGGERLILWNTSDWTELWRVKMDSSGRARVNCAAISPDGRWVCAGFSDDSLGFWAVSTGDKALHYHGRRILRFEGRWPFVTAAFPKEYTGEGVVSVNFSPDGYYVASGSYDGAARIWLVP